MKRKNKITVGLDEVGRGPLAGPVVACAVVADRRTFLRWRSVLPDIKDSKKLTKKKREELYEILTNHPAIEWGIGRVSEKTIDKINILEATKLAMIKAVKNISCKRICGHKRHIKRHVKRRIDFLIVDGKMKLDLPIPQRSIVKADEKVFSCMAASIIAKVTRDGIMEKYHKKYPQYGFDRHKGYGTPFHIKMLKRYGRCDIHRNSFKITGVPMRSMGKGGKKRGNFSDL